MGGCVGRGAAGRRGVWHESTTSTSLWFISVCLIVTDWLRLAYPAMVDHSLVPPFDLRRRCHVTQCGIHPHYAQPRGYTSHLPAVQRARPVRGEVQRAALSANKAALAGLFGRSMLWAALGVPTAAAVTVAKSFRAPKLSSSCTASIHFQAGL